MSSCYTFCTYPKCFHCVCVNDNFCFLPGYRSVVDDLHIVFHAFASCKECLIDNHCQAVPIALFHGVQFAEGVFVTAEFP
jgi:hypothetical protein